MDNEKCIVTIDSHEEYYDCKRPAIKDGLCKIHSKGPLGKLLSFAGNTGIKVGTGFGMKELIEMLGGLLALGSVDTANQFFDLNTIEEMSPEELMIELENLVNEIHESGKISIKEHTLDAADAFSLKRSE